MVILFQKYFSKCTGDPRHDYSYGFDNADMLLAMRSVVLFAALTATLAIFIRVKWADIPKIVVWIWVLIDAASLLNFFFTIILGRWRGLL